MNTFIIETILLFFASLIFVFFTVKINLSKTTISSKKKILKLLEYIIGLILITIISILAIHKKILLLSLSIVTYIIIKKTNWREKLDL